MGFSIICFCQCSNWVGGKTRRQHRIAQNKTKINRASCFQSTHRPWQAEERVATVNMALAGVDPGMVVEFATFTPETHGPVVQVLRGVLYALGHSRSTAEVRVRFCAP